MSPLTLAADVADYRRAARRRLPNMLFEYIDGGSYAEATLRRNVADLAGLALRQRVMRDMSELDMTLQSLGRTWSMPVGIGPVGLAGMYARRGEVQGARAAAAAGIPFCLSTVGICSVEEVAGAGVPPWFQLYVLKDRGYMRELVRRAHAAGSPVLVLTVDLPRRPLGLSRAQRAARPAQPGAGRPRSSPLALGRVAVGQASPPRLGRGRAARG